MEDGQSAHNDVRTVLYGAAIVNRGGIRLSPTPGQTTRLRLQQAGPDEKFSHTSELHQLGSDFFQQAGASTNV